MFKTKPFWIYSLVLVVWAAVTSVTSGLVFKLLLHEVEAAFDQRIEQLQASIERITRDNESILEGLSAFLGAIEYADRDSVSRYARQILARYPHVYALEVVRSVEKKDLAHFVARQKRTWFPDFEVKTFTYDSDRTWQPVDDKPLYYPIIFIEPMLPESRPVIGLDVDSVPFLRDAMNQSAALKASVASVPFKLVEGFRAYTMFHPVINSAAFSKRKQAFAELVINADVIFNEIKPLVENMDVRLYHTGFSSDAPEGTLFHVAASAPDGLGARLLPKLSAERKLDSRSQPFALRADTQPGWSDLDLPFAMTTGCISFLSLGFLLILLANHFRMEEQSKKSADRLRHMATHDDLTGLPNRTLLADRFSQACSRAQRRDTPFSALFLDLNDFKKVNDTHGHDVGDQLLKAMGSLLKECIREEDTVGRISGDEFVVLLEDTPYENAEKVAQKIQDKMALPVPIQGIELSIGLSIGIAAYPDDGKTMSELLTKADERMYQAKVQNKAAVE